MKDGVVTTAKTTYSQSSITPSHDGYRKAYQLITLTLSVETQNTNTKVYKLKTRPVLRVFLKIINTSIFSHVRICVLQ